MEAIESIFVADTVCEDRVFPVPQDVYDGLVRRFHLKADGKTPVDSGAMSELLDALSGYTPRIARGGSAATMSFTLKGLFPHLDILFGSALGGTDFAPTIRGTFQGAGIELLQPESTQAAQRHALTVSLMPPQGGRAYATDAGTIGQVITPDILTDDLFRKRDVIHLMLTTREKERLGEEFIDRELKLRWIHQKFLWVNLPTHPEYTLENDANADFVQRTLPSANLVLGNMDELKATYRTDDGHHARLQLQHAFRQNVLEYNGWTGPHAQQAAFITDDKNHAFAITAERIASVRPPTIPASEVLSNGGAGDTALAGMVGGHAFRGLSLEESLSVGHVLAAAKLRQFEPCLPNPRRALRQGAPELASALFDRSASGVVEGAQFVFV